MISASTVAPDAVAPAHPHRRDTRILVEERFFLEVEAPVAAGAAERRVGARFVAGDQVVDIAPDERERRIAGVAGAAAPAGRRARRTRRRADAVGVTSRRRGGATAPARRRGGGVALGSRVGAAVGTSATPWALGDGDGDAARRRLARARARRTAMATATAGGLGDGGAATSVTTGCGADGCGTGVTAGAEVAPSSGSVPRFWNAEIRAPMPRPATMTPMISAAIGSGPPPVPPALDLRRRWSDGGGAVRDRASHRAFRAFGKRPCRRARMRRT